MNRAPAFRTLTLLTAVVLLLAACSSQSKEITTTEPDTTSTAPPTTTSTIPPTTSTSVTEAPSTVTLPQRGAAGASERSIGDPYYPELGNGGYDVAHYDIQLEFDPETRMVAATVAIESTATSDLDTFSLDFAGFVIEQVTVDGGPVEFIREDEELVITLENGIGAGESFTTSVAYRGEPTTELSAAVAVSVGWRTDSAGTNYTATEPDGAHWWFPGNDHPLDKATFRFELTVPQNVVAAATGTLVDSRGTSDGRTVSVWEMRQPMATYVAGVVIGDMQLVTDEEGSTLTGVTIRHLLPEDVAAELPEPMLRIGEMIEYLSEVFGPYPYDDFGISLVNGFNAALENQTLSIFDTFLLGDDELFEIVLVHELAHHWYGNSVSPGLWQDIWLNEGFATYAEWLWLEREFGPATRDSNIRQVWSEVRTAPPPGAPPSDDLFNASVYWRGGLTLHALRLEVGDGVFFEILRTYADGFAHGNAVTDDFIAVAEDISGKELDAIFADWLYAEEIPELDV